MANLDNEILVDSWRVFPKSNVSIKTCDKSFYEYGETGLPKNGVCEFWGIQNEKESRNVILVYSNKEYSANIVIKNDGIGRAVLTWKKDLREQLKNDGLTLNMDVCFRRISNDKYIMEIHTSDAEYYNFSDDSKEDGDIKKRISIGYERNPINRKNAILIHGLVCQACGFDFEKAYGELGKNFIEVHHIVPLSSVKEKMKIDPETDLICLCSNCHSMIHRIKTDDYHNSLKILRKIISEQRSTDK